MPEALELPSLTAAAARAASEDDIPTAAALLRQAVELQVSTIGPDHPDVATTINNLGLMLERLGHVKEAGQCYRRAHAIAAAALGPDDPVVQVSRANLDAFRATYAQSAEGDDAAVIDPSVWGDLGDFPAASAAAPAANERRAADSTADAGAPAVASAASEAAPASGESRPPWRTPVLELAAGPGPEPGVAPDVDREWDLSLTLAPRAAVQPAPRPTLTPTPTPAPPSARVSGGTRRGPSPVLLVLAALLAGAIGWWSMGLGSSAPTVASDESGSSTGTPTAAGPEATGGTATAQGAAPAAPTTAPTAPAAAPMPAAPLDAPPPRAIEAGPAAAGEASPPSPSPARPAASGSVGVAVAQLCSALSRSRNPWVCAPSASPARSDAVYYYTRVRSTRDVTIRHRWARDGRVVQDVRLRIRANPTDGFRTFSRQTVSGLGAGAWVVTLLGPGGERLDEKAFAVK